MQTTNWPGLLLTVLAATCVGTAMAQAPTVKELQDINQQRILLEAQLKRVELQKRLLEMQTQMATLSASRKAAAAAAPVSDLARAEPTPVVMPRPPMPAAEAPVPVARPAPEPERVWPTVAYVEGLKGQLEAVLIHKGQGQQRVRQGDWVQGGRVQKISLNEVVVVDEKTQESRVLHFGNGGRDSGFVASPAGMPPMRGMPNMAAMGR
jgi:type IV pilus biogenesis protein PilP